MNVKNISAAIIAGAAIVLLFVYLWKYLTGKDK